jgi:hypothetical protein
MPIQVDWQRETRGKTADHQNNVTDGGQEAKESQHGDNSDDSSHHSDWSNDSHGCVLSAVKIGRQLIHKSNRLIYHQPLSDDNLEVGSDHSTPSPSSKKDARPRKQ